MAQKLWLHRETLAELTHKTLRGVAGGVIVNASHGECASNHTCPSQACPTASGNFCRPPTQ